MTQPRIHHYIQQAHLNLFSDDQKIIAVVNTEGEVFRVSSKNIFAERDLYSHELSDVVDTSFETAIGKLESQTFPTIQKIANAKSIDEEDKPALIAYISLSLLRNPVFQSGVIDKHRLSVEALAETLDQQEKLPKLKIDGHPWNGKSISELISTKQVQFGIDNSRFTLMIANLLERIIKLINAFNYSVLVSDDSLIAIGDHPVTFNHPGVDFGAYGPPLGGQDCEITFPISKNCCIIGRWDSPFQNSNSYKAVEQVNRRQAVFASRHLAASRDVKKFAGWMKKYSHVKFQAITSTMPSENGTVIITRRGLFPSPERKKIINDISKLGSLL
jgi:uncharacterized protein DUF4238